MPISKDDRQAFAEATRDVKRLRSRNTVPRPQSRPKPQARFSRAENAAALEASLTDDDAAPAAEEISYRRPQLSERAFRDLRRGRFTIEAEIDLHGLTQHEAKSALHEFIDECIGQRLRCVRVIHGKGARSGADGPVLKASVQVWLPQWDDVLGYVSARRRDGGSGAVYVLLRRR